MFDLASLRPRTCILTDFGLYYDSDHETSSTTRYSIFDTRYSLTRNLTSPLIPVSIKMHAIRNRTNLTPPSIINQKIKNRIGLRVYIFFDILPRGHAERRVFDYPKPPNLEKNRVRVYDRQKRNWKDITIG